MIFRKGELFNGPGGFAWAAKHANIEVQGEEYSIEHAWSNDYDLSACETYRYNICRDRPETVYHEDVRKLDLSSLSEIDAFIYGFPCNDFSIVGEKKGFDGQFGPLYTYGIKILKKFQPKWFIAENVGGLQSANDGQAFIQILTEMRQAGYRLTPHLYNFASYGVPQSRQRILIVGFRNDLNVEFRVPAPTHGPGLIPYRTAYEAITNPPIADGAFNHDMPKHTKKVVEFLGHIPPGQNAWYEGIPEHLRLNVKGARMSQIYRRLDKTSPSYTVTGSGGGGTHMYHWEEPRALTNRERARLQTFPDIFEFKGPKDKVRQQVGMAVPPDGAKIIIEAVLKTYAGVAYDFINPKWDVDELLESNPVSVI